MTITGKRIWQLGLVAATAGLLACNSGSSGGSSSSGGGDTGQMSLAVTDAPVNDASKVVLKFTEVELSRSGGDDVVITFDEIQEIDLLALQGEDSFLLFEDEEIPAGDYQWIRFKVEADPSASPGQSRLVTTSFIEFRPDTRGSGEPLREQLVIPGGAQAGVQTQGGFTIPADGFVGLTVDFDLRKLITEGTGPRFDGFHRMRRTGLRIIENADVGVIFGEVDESLIDNGQCMHHEDEAGYFACPGLAVYVYDGEDQPLLPVFIEAVEDGDDIEAPGNPVTTSNVRLQITEDEEGNEEWRYSYNAGFLAPGTYTVALTFDADQDDPNEDDEIPFAFVNGSVPVVAGERTRVDFPDDAEPVDAGEDEDEEDDEEDGNDD